MDRPPIVDPGGTVRSRSHRLRREVDSGSHIRRLRSAARVFVRRLQRIVRQNRHAPNSLLMRPFFGTDRDSTTNCSCVTSSCLKPTSVCATLSGISKM
jgi:hypothetical protein